MHGALLRRSTRHSVIKTLKTSSNCRFTSAAAVWGCAGIRVDTLMCRYRPIRVLRQSTCPEMQPPRLEDVEARVMYEFQHITPRFNFRRACESVLATELRVRLGGRA